MNIGSSSSSSPKCLHCGLIHETTCPKIKAIEYHENGIIKRVEFFSATENYIPYTPMPVPSEPWPVVPRPVPYYRPWPPYTTTYAGFTPQPQ